MNSPVTNPVDMGKTIIEVGFIVMAAACYLIYSSVIIFFFVKWFIRLVNGIVNDRRSERNEALRLLREILNKL